MKTNSINDLSQHDESLGKQLDQYLAALCDNETAPKSSQTDEELDGLEPVIDQLFSLAQYVTLADSDTTTGRDPATSQLSIGKYVLQKRLGRGGQSTAFLAVDPDLRRPVVIKLYHAIQSPKQQEAVLNEGRALAQVQSPYVAHCYGTDRHRGLPYLILEYVEGDTLAEIQRSKPLTVPATLEVIDKLAAGLAMVHANGLVHRDVKPANIIIGLDGQPRLVDFGLAETATDIASDRACGTPAYMAPEQARGEAENVGAHSDIFGLGAVLYELLTGRAPFQADSSAESLQLARVGEVRSPKELTPGLPRNIESLCMRCVAADPTERFASAEELQAAIARIHRSRRSRKALWTALAAAIVLVFAGIAVGLNRDEPFGGIKDLAQARVTPKPPSDPPVGAHEFMKVRDDSQFDASGRRSDPNRYFDVDGNGWITSQDVDLLTEHIKAGKPFNPKLDVNSDRAIDNWDIHWLLRELERNEQRRVAQLQGNVEENRPQLGSNEIEIKPRADRHQLDVNGDGRISASDAELIREHLDGKRPVHEHFDVDQDGIVKALDLLRVINFLNRRIEDEKK